jgi:hypothetical protein
LQASGEFAQVRKRLEPSLVLSGQPVKRGTMAHEHIVYMMLVDSAVQARDQAAILAHAPRLEELSTRDDHHFYLAVSHRAFGVAHLLAEQYSEAESRLQQALQVFDEMSTTWQRGRTYFWLGELAKQKGDTALSEEMYTLALEDFEGLQAGPDAARVETAIGVASTSTGVSTLPDG